MEHWLKLYVTQISWYWLLVTGLLQQTHFQAELSSSEMANGQKVLR